MNIRIYRRHSKPRACDKHARERAGIVAGCTGCDPKGCAHREDPYRKEDCGCPVWFEWHSKGKQYRQSSKETNWKAAQRIASKMEDDAAEGRANPNAPKTVEEVIEIFLADRKDASHSKVSADGQVTPDTLSRHELALERLQTFCDAQRITYAKDITAANLVEWRATWTFKAAQARASFQARVKCFFKFAFANGYIGTNPAAGLSTISVAGAKKQRRIRHLSPAQYATLLATIDKTEMTPANKFRVNVMMRLQREAGLAIVDAALLSSDELQRTSMGYVIKTDRQKTGTGVSVPISMELAKDLLKVKNGNPKYVFHSGATAREEDAPDAFQKLYRRVAKRLPFKFSSHDLRHTFAVAFLDAGGTMRELSKSLGHSSMDITEDFYAAWSHEADDARLKACRAALPKSDSATA